MLLIIIGILGLITGIFLFIHPAKDMDIYYGFRTKFSLKSKVIWDDANRLYKYLAIVLGIITIISGNIFYFLFNDGFVNFQFALTIALGFSSFIITEVYIRHKYRDYTD